MGIFGTKQRPEVLVVGAGPVGLLAALCLARRGIAVEIVDREWRTGAHSYALALHPQSLALLDEVGLREAVLDQAYRVESVALYDRQKRHAELRVADGDAPVAVLRQDVLEHHLEEALKRAGVPVHWNHEVSQFTMYPGTVAVTIDRLEKASTGYAVAHTEWNVVKTYEEEVPYVLGADGHNSVVRRLLGFDYVQAGPTQHFAVFEFQVDTDLKQQMRLIFDPQTTDMLWPLPGGYCRWSFQLPEFELPPSTRVKDRLAVESGSAYYPVLTADHLETFLAKRAPWFKGSRSDINWRIAVRFDRRLASSFGRQRAWLAGDAAHMTSPVGMQSMNVGLREARDLAQLFAQVLREGQPASRLAEYDRQRQAEWRLLLQGQFRPTTQTEPWLRPYVDRLLPCLPASGDRLAALGQQLAIQGP